MSKIKSSKKRIIINKLRNKINISKKSKLKTFIKKFNLLINKNNKNINILNYRILQSILDKLSIKGIIHYNKCSRYKSKYFKLIKNII